jgi:hypothetical protein
MRLCALLAVPRYRPSQPKVRSTIHRFGRAFQRESSRHAFAGGIPKIGEPGASSIRAVPSLHSAGAVLCGSAAAKQGLAPSPRGACPSFAAETVRARGRLHHRQQSAHEFAAQLPCRPQHPRIRTGGKRTTHGVRVLYRPTHAASAAPGMMKMGLSFGSPSRWRRVSGRRPVSPWGLEPAIESGPDVAPYPVLLPPTRGARGAE